MENSQIDNKRIAKNTLMLYCRMGVMMLVSLYTSRMVLATLGIENYGIYNVVGGFVAIMGFLNNAMTTSTQRYLTFELGKGDIEKLKKVFVTSINLHIIVSILVVLLGETVGLWFLYNKMVIPPERMQATFWVFQLSLATSAISIMSFPYNAAIIAHERMSAFAYISVLDGLLKFLIVLLLLLAQWDKLVFYAFLMVVEQVLIQYIYSRYCTKHFIETRYSFSHSDKILFREMLGFSCLDLYGNASARVRDQGTDILLNMFFKVSMNAACAIATQVQYTMGSLSSNIVQAFSPQIVKTYAKGDYKGMSVLLIKASQYTTMLLLLTIPLYMEIDYILKLWLKEVPYYTEVLCKYTLSFNILVNLSACLIIGLHATKQIKQLSFINGTLYLLIVPVSYFLYSRGGKPEIAYMYNVLAEFICIFLDVFTLHYFVPEFKRGKYIKEVFCKCSMIAFILFCVSISISNGMQEGLLRLITDISINAIIIAISTFYIIMKKEERNSFVTKLKYKLFGKV